MSRQNWTRDEAILALLQYYVTPFGKIGRNNPKIIALGSLIGRTPDAVAMKMCNFARLDPAMKERNVTGLQNGSKIEEVVWNEYSHDWNKLVSDASIVRSRYGDRPLEDQIDLSGRHDFPEGLEREQIVYARLNRHYFREALLAAYHSTCCVTGLKMPDLLIASHIKPWSASDPRTERTNPSNGLLLNALHGRAFDRGLITINPSFEIIISSKISQVACEPVFYEWFESFQGKAIMLPEKFIPDKRFIEYHNDVVFVR